MASFFMDAAETLRAIFLTADGLQNELYALADRDEVNPAQVDVEQVLARNVAAGVNDQNTPSIYPLVLVYCTKAENLQEQKFTAFSGRVTVVVELRSSQPRMETLESETARLVEAVTNLMNLNVGKWTDELAFDGKYEVQFEPIKVGGIGFLQSAKIEIELLANA